MQRTRIEWVRNQDGSQGCTLNPIKGLCPMHCKNLEGYEYCYAAGKRGLYKRFKWNKAIRFNINPLLAIKRRKKPAGIFLGSTFELFWDGLERFWLDSIFATIRACPQHRFYLLTKCPQNLIKFSPFPQNCYVGATATNQEQFDNAVKYLKQVEATVKFLSFEPLLSHIILDKSLPGGSKMPNKLEQAGIDWVIIGSQSQPNIYAKEEWIQEIEQACDKVGIPIFEKSNLRRVWDKPPRQEMPDADKEREILYKHPHLCKPEYDEEEI